MTNDELKMLRDLAAKATRVVAWYPHLTEVRGPYHRWLTCSEVAPEYREHVAEPEDDCRFATAAMNSLVPLLDHIATVTAERDRLVDAPGDIRSQPAYQSLSRAAQEMNAQLAAERLANGRLRRALENAAGVLESAAGRASDRGAQRFLLAGWQHAHKALDAQPDAGAACVEALEEVAQADSGDGVDEFARVIRLCKAALAALKGGV